MPKMKSHRGAAKRFKVSPTGKIRRRSAFANHLLSKKSAQRKRRLAAPTEVAKPDERNVRRLLGR
jgi:large subunit ribosomal protein L35